jgi:uncharacterized protein YdeI (YjbR/CyaY-like superfamily)
MGAADRRCSVWFERDGEWKVGMRALRDILLDTPLEEGFKWRGPVYSYGGANLAMIFGVADGFGVSFFRGVLLGDPQGLLELPGPNSRSARYLKFREENAVAASEDVLRAFIEEAIDLQAKGVRVELDPDDLDLPPELVEALDDDPQLAEAFAGLTPGRRRGWAIQIGGAKKPETRRSRIERARPEILAGRGIHDR